MRTLHVEGNISCMLPLPRVHKGWRSGDSYVAKIEFFLPSGQS